MTRLSSPMRPVLIVGMEPRITIPIARSLHAYGVPVDVAALSSHDAVAQSRAVRQFLRLPELVISSVNFADVLARLISDRGYDMLIPATDAALAAISEHDARLRSLLLLACPRPEIVQRVLNKLLTVRIAQQCGIHVPRSYQITTPTQLDAVASELSFPVVAKPYHKSSETDFKVRYFNTLHDLEQAISADVHFGSQVLLQEYCPGNGVGVEVLLHEGDAIAVFQHRRIKEVPHTGGAAIIAIAETPDKELVDQALTLLRAIQWEGVAMVEFRFDPSTRRSALMEVNGRYWGTLALPIKAGVDFPLYQYQVMQGEQPSVPATYAVGTRWRWTAGYLRRSRGVLVSCLRNGRQRLNLAAELLRAPLDLLQLNQDAMWSWSDPKPAVSELTREIKSQIFGHEKKTVSPNSSLQSDTSTPQAQDPVQGNRRSAAALSASHHLKGDH